MPEKIIKEALGELRSEGGRIADAQARERLAGLVETIEKSAASAEERRGLIADIRSAIEHFEVEHPRVTESLNRIMMALSNMGI